jgi:Zn-dependent peptidase ImmA (M78 family)
MQFLADRLLDEGGWDRPPASLSILASFQGIHDVRLAAMQSAGRLVYRDGSLIVELNEEHSLGKRNFTADHEVSHTLVPTYGGQPVDDPETGTFSQGNEEELLCDVGAAALLLPPRWLRSHAVNGGPSISTLLGVASVFESSLEAAARQLAHMDCWPGAFVCWEEGWRKEDQIPNGQLFMPGLEGFGELQPKWRACRAYPTRSFGYFVPTNKSIEDSSLVAACCEADPFTWGVENIDLGKGPQRMYCENYYAPYRKFGTIRGRVISLLMPAPLRHGEPALPTARQMELL